MSTVSDALTAAVQAALEPLPTADGGIAIVLATAGTPPAIAVLSSGDVRLVGSTVRVVLHGDSSAGARLGGAFSLLVPDTGRALRVEAVDATVRAVGAVQLIEGRLAGIRPTAEPPWTLAMTFGPVQAGSGDVGRFVSYWQGVREWLAEPEQEPPPLP